MVMMCDASTEPGNLPSSKYRVVAGYIGGNTPHIWTVEEWHRFPRRALLPIFVYTGNGGQQDALAALQAIYRLGIPRGSRIVYDMETRVDKVSVRAFYSVLSYFGYKVWVYGSKEFVFGNPPCDGYWIADWTGQPHMVLGPYVRATQWTSGDLWDLSLIKRWVFFFKRSVWWRS